MRLRMSKLLPWASLRGVLTACHVGSCALEELVKGQGATDAKHRRAYGFEEDPQYAFDFGGSVDVFVAHQNSVVEAILQSEFQAGCEFPAECPQQRALAGNGHS